MAEVAESIFGTRESSSLSLPVRAATDARIVAVGLVGIALAVLLFEFLPNRGFLGSDDAYIHLRYIDNFRQGLGFSFNPEISSNGSTSPLWVVLAATILSGSSDLMQSIRFLSVSLFVGSVLFCYLLSLKLTHSSWFSLIPTLIYASDPWLLKWGATAMESSATALAVLGVAILLLHSQRPAVSVVTALVLGLASLIRPEFAFLLLLFLILQLTIPGTNTERIRRSVLVSLAFVVGLLPWLVFSVSEFGSPVPNTFFAKTVASSNSVWAVLWYFIRIEAVSYFWAWGAILLAGVGLVISALKGSKVGLTGYRLRATASLLVWSVAIPLLYGVGRLQTPSTRYLQLTTPVLIVLGCYGVYLIVKSDWFESVPVSPKALTIVFAAAIVTLNVVLNAAVVLPSSREFSDGVLETYRATGEWLAINTAPDTRVAISIDVGVIAFYANREIIDLGGLNTPQVIGYFPDRLAYLFVSRPDYLVITGETDRYSLSENERFKEIAKPVHSSEIHLGRRSQLQQATGGRQALSQYVTVYRLEWDE